MISTKTLSALGISGLAVLGFIGLGYAGGGESQDTAISPDILFLTQPVFSMPGIIQKIEGNKFTFQARLTQRTAGSTASFRTRVQPMPVKQESVTLDYEFFVSSNTEFQRTYSPVPYLIRASTVTQSPPGNYNEPRVGDVAQVISEKDLRTLAQRKFSARSIRLFPIPNAVSGNISEIKGNVISLHGAVIRNVPRSMLTEGDNEEKDYQVTVTKETEISRMDNTMNPGKPAQAKSMKISELEKGMNLTVYSDADVSSSVKFKALRIEPGINMAAAPSGSVESVSPGAKSTGAVNSHPHRPNRN